LAHKKIGVTNLTHLQLANEGVKVGKLLKENALRGSPRHRDLQRRHGIGGRGGYLDPQDTATAESRDGCFTSSCTPPSRKAATKEFGRGSRGRPEKKNGRQTGR